MHLELGKPLIEVVERDVLTAFAQIGEDTAELAEELANAQAIIFGTPANFGYLSGALKHYFDVTYHAARNHTAGVPTTWWIRGGFDTTGAERAMQSILTGYGVRIAAPPVAWVGDSDTAVAELVDSVQATVAVAFQE